MNGPYLNIARFTTAQQMAAKLPAAIAGTDWKRSFGMEQWLVSLRCYDSTSVSEAEIGHHRYTPDPAKPSKKNHQPIAMRPLIVVAIPIVAMRLRPSTRSLLMTAAQNTKCAINAAAAKIVKINMAAMLAHLAIDSNWEADSQL